MKFIRIISLSLTLCLYAYGQTTERSSPQFFFLPDGLQFAPLKANIQEPRIGVFKFLDAGLMKVDIGNSIDVLGLAFPQGVTCTLGIDFMAYALATNAHGLRLQIDALDGFFGGNLTISKRLEPAASETEFSRNVYLARLRILHQSAHMVDGHYVENANSHNPGDSWIDGRVPIPFTRDFGELVVSHTFAPGGGAVRYYAGISYATLVRPDAIQRFAYLGGFEIYKSLGSITAKETNLFFSYNITITGTPAYSGTHQVQVGYKLGSWDGKGPAIYLAYYTGRHMFAEYFDEQISTIGAGFTVDWD